MYSLILIHEIYSTFFDICLIFMHFFNGTCFLYILVLGFDICHMKLYCNFRSNSNVTIKTHMKEGVPKSAPSFGRPYGYKESKIWYLLKKNYGCISLQINVHFNYIKLVVEPEKFTTLKH